MIACEPFEHCSVIAWELTDLFSITLGRFQLAMLLFTKAGNYSQYLFIDKNNITSLFSMFVCVCLHAHA